MMKKQKTKQRQKMEQKQKVVKNNKGFSLVEVIISVTILSIVATVAYRMFIISTKVNYESKLTDKGKIIAQDVIESFKSSTLEDLALELEYPKYVVDDVTYERFGVLPKNYTYSLDNIGAFSTYIDTDDGGSSGTLVHTADEKYYYYINNIISNDNAYDCLITVDGSGYVEDDFGNTLLGKKYNSSETFFTPSMSEITDGIISKSNSWDAQSLWKLSQKYSTYDESKIKRSFDITLSATPNVKAVVVYNYEYEGEIFFSRTDTIYSGEKLNNLFLFYTPQYSWGEDSINITYPKDYEFDFYIVKQITEGISTPMLNNMELNYRAKVNVTEEGIANPSIAKPGVKIKTNLGYSFETLEPIAVPQATYTYCGEDTVHSMYVGSVITKVATSHLYSIQVDVFKDSDVPLVLADYLSLKNSDKYICSMNGSFSN